MKKLFAIIKDKYLNDSLDFRAQIFNLLALTGMVLGVVIGISCVITNAGAVNIAVNLLASIFALAMLEYSSRTGRYERCYLITIVAVFIIAFPVLFFTAGGYHSGTPSFFIFALVFTVFMLKGKSMYVLAVLELILYIGVCLIAYHYPQTVSFFDTERDMVTDIVVGFTATSSALGITVFRHTRIYDKKQNELTEANAALGRVNRMKTEFLGNVSHELKTPLTVISGYAQESAKKLSNLPGMEETERSMKLIASEADRLALMVSQILDVTRIDEGRMSVNIQPVFLPQILQITLQTYYPVFTKNNNSLELARGSGSPTVLCDPQRVAQVLVNLIGNAARHTHDGKIIISVNVAEGFAEISVADTGEGISPERQADLFERFNTSAKSKDTRSGRETGTGLGLFICKHIVEEHGGQITVESEGGKGTTVRFTLPLQS